MTIDMTFFNNVYINLDILGAERSEGCIDFTPMCGFFIYLFLFSFFYFCIYHRGLEQYNCIEFLQQYFVR